MQPAKEQQNLQDVSSASKQDPSAASSSSSSSSQPVSAETQEPARLPFGSLAVPRPDPLPRPAEPRRPHHQPHQRRASKSFSGPWVPSGRAPALSPPPFSPATPLSGSYQPGVSRSAGIDARTPQTSASSLRHRSSVKRPSHSQHGRAEGSAERSPVKKARRTGSSPSRRRDMLALPAGMSGPNATDPRDGPPSPLFFSNSGTPKSVSRPHSFSTNEVVASMLAGMKQEAAVTTLKLPRASVSTVSPARSGSTPGSWSSSMDVSAPPLSMDPRSLPPGLQMLQGIGIIELLEMDQRPTFLIDLGNPANMARPGLHIMYYNKALRTCPEILHLLSVSHDDSTVATEFGRFKLWMMGSNKDQEGAELPTPPHTYRGITWTCTTLRRRFRFVSGNSHFTHIVPNSPELLETHALSTAHHSPIASPSRPSTPLSESMEGPEAPDYFGKPGLEPFSGEALDQTKDLEMTDGGDSTRKHPDDFTNEVLQALPTKATFDWTRLSITHDLPDHIAFAKTHDWSSTPLGPMSEWSNDLRMISNLLMGSPHPAALYWGPQFVSMYNAAYIELAGQKHPKLMGQLYVEAWPEIWDAVKPVFENAWECGQATMKHEDQLFINRNGFLEETFFSWSLIPIVGSEGDVIGLFNPAFENTRRRVSERRMLTLREIGERTSIASSVDEFWPQVRKGLEYNEWDVPFALLYAVKDDTESEVSSLQSGSYAPAQLVLEGSLGIPEGHVLSSPSVDLRSSSEGFAPYMRQSMIAGGDAIVLSQEDGTLPAQLIDGLEWRGFGDPCRKLVIMPVIPTTGGEAVAGFIIVGVNPRRPYDDDYKLFINLLSRQLATSLASVVLFEEEIKRGQRAAQLAAMDRQELSMQLVLRTQQANESEYRFTRMAEFAPVGMFIADSEGRINYCNDMWWQISRHSRKGQSETSWMESVRQEDRSRLEDTWQTLLRDKVTISVEFRFNGSQRSGNREIDTWVLMSAFPEKTQDGLLKSIFGCITDISTQKWAEQVQKERREEAVELKRQQENFIDITSHEMRNPLSAVLQCADQIAGHVANFTEFSNRDSVERLLDSCLDAANTINLCASHQKRIVDDILTLSKLDSKLLAVTPVDEQPVRCVQRALKMFESELVAHDIEFEFRVDKSFEKYGITWLRLDPSRLRQVLINLMTNAIKFTQSRQKRSIIVSLGVSRDISEVTRDGTIYFEKDDTERGTTMDIDNEDDWGRGERINLHCSVEDTGPGLGDEELKILFQRFRQATPRTHVQYGGSGLGLFISRILTEMQGGQIGVTSRRGQGSKFSFYIQSRKCDNPPADYEHIVPYKIERKSQSPAAVVVPTQHAPRPRHESNASLGHSPLFDVLIVEDNIVNQKVLQRQLRSAGNNTFVANHGREALQTLEKSRFWAGKEDKGVDISVILMDLEMPVMDGMTCARRIRELEKEGTIVQHIPIIAVTAYARPEQIENAKAAGIDDVISKPFRIPDLLPKIEELVGLAECTQECAALSCNQG